MFEPRPGEADSRNPSSAPSADGGGVARDGSETPPISDIVPGVENVTGHLSPAVECEVPEAFEPGDVAIVLSDRREIVVAVELDREPTNAGPDFGKSAFKECVRGAQTWLASARRCDLALYALLEKVATFRADPRFEVKAFCLATGRRFTKATAKNASMVILQAITKEAGEEIPRKTASKYGRVVEWIGRQPGSPRVARYLTENKGIQGVDELMRDENDAQVKSDANNKGTQGADRSMRAETALVTSVTPAPAAFVGAANGARLLNVPGDLPDGVEIIAFREGDIFKFRCIVLEGKAAN